MTGPELEAKIVAAALTDEQFRKELLNDPKRTFEKYFDVELDPNLSLKIVEEKEGEAVLVIPAEPALRSMPVNEIEEYLLGTCNHLYGEMLGTCGACGTLHSG